VFKDDFHTDGSSSAEKLIATRTRDGDVRLQLPDEAYGEYYTIDQQGTLRFWSGSRNYFSAPPRSSERVDLSAIPEG
jgi:hypothetical protein